LLAAVLPLRGSLLRVGTAQILKSTSGRGPGQKAMRIMVVG
jgi:hypothetical protein